MTDRIQILQSAMTWLSKQDRTIFLGQNICYPYSQMYPTFADVPPEKKIEMPIAEEMQMGITLGLSLEGYIPISVYPRIDFVVLALNQLVNHIDKLVEMSSGMFNPGLIVRTQIGHKKPLNAGFQHTNDHTEAFSLMLNNVKVYKLTSLDAIMPTYEMVYEEAKKGKASVVIEDIQ
jgi:pyruvate/2-oxoglutarate/acetoin dehydrogenase E1 component